MARKLPDEQTLEILSAYVLTVSISETARQCSVPKSTVQTVLNRLRGSVRETVDFRGINNRTRKGGAPRGNKNSVGHGAPRGNRNALVHGAYSSVLVGQMAEIDWSQVEPSVLIPADWANLPSEIRELYVKQALLMGYARRQSDQLDTEGFLRANELLLRIEGRILRHRFGDRWRSSLPRLTF